MSEIPSVMPPYSVIRPGKVKKDGKKPPDKQQQGQQKPVLEEPDTRPSQHIDEIV